MSVIHFVISFLVSGDNFVIRQLMDVKGQSLYRLLCILHKIDMVKNHFTLLPPPRRLCFCQFLSVCLCVSKITQKVMDGSF